LVGLEDGANKMGLDQYMYVAAKAGTAWDDTSRRELAYRRKHPNLQGWMRELWLRKLKNNECTNDSDDNTFNGVELELTWEDIERLEQAVINGDLPQTTGFFFGDDSDDYYRDQDLEFIKNARAELFVGLKVFYNSSW